MCIFAVGIGGGGGGGGGSTGCAPIDPFGDKMSVVSLRLPAEAFERRKFDESESQREWKDSSSDESASVSFLLHS